MTQVEQKNTTKDKTLQHAPNSPHYKGFAIEPIEYIEANNLGPYAFHVGNIVKYVSRYQQKDGISDLKKALWYLQRLIELEEKNHTT